MTAGNAQPTATDAMLAAVEAAREDPTMDRIDAAIRLLDKAPDSLAKEKSRLALKALLLGDDIFKNGLHEPISFGRW